MTRTPHDGTNRASRAEPTGIGWKRVLALGLLLAAVAAVAYLDQVVAGGFDLTLVYFSIVLTAAILMPPWWRSRLRARWQS